MFNSRSTEAVGDQEKDDDLLSDLNLIYNQVLNNDLNCVYLKDFSTGSDDLCPRSTDRTSDDTKHVSNEDQIDESNDDLNDLDVHNVNNHLKANEPNHQSDDEDNQYLLFSNLVNNQLILNSKVSEPISDLCVCV